MKLWTYLILSKIVVLFSAAFTLICSRLMSRFSRSALARALASASMDFSLFFSRSSISCSIVARRKASCFATLSSCLDEIYFFLFAYMLYKIGYLDTELKVKINQLFSSVVKLESQSEVQYSMSSYIFTKPFQNFRDCNRKWVLKWIGLQI